MNYSHDYKAHYGALKYIEFFQVGKLYAIGIFCKITHHNDMINDPEFTGEMEDLLFYHKWNEYQNKMEDLYNNRLYPLKSNSFWNSASDICIDLDSDKFRRFCYFEPFTVLSIEYLSYERCILHIMQTCNGNTEIGNILLWRDESPKTKFFSNGLFLSLEDTARMVGKHEF